MPCFQNRAYWFRMFRNRFSTWKYLPILIDSFDLIFHTTCTCIAREQNTTMKNIFSALSQKSIGISFLDLPPLFQNHFRAQMIVDSETSTFLNSGTSKCFGALSWFFARKPYFHRSHDGNGKGRWFNPSEPPLNRNNSQVSEFGSIHHLESSE